MKKAFGSCVFLKCGENKSEGKFKVLEWRHRDVDEFFCLC